MALIPMIFKADGGEDYPKKGKIRAEDLSALFAFSLSKKTGILNVLGTCTAYNVVVSSGYATISFHNGYIVVGGRLIYIEEGTAITVALASSGSVAGKIGVRVSLSSSGNTECEWFNKTTDLEQDDLNNNPVSGVYEFPLYEYTATATNFVLGNKVGASISPNADLVEGIIDTSAKAAKYAADSEGEPLTSKGTIDGRLEELSARLDVLGFSQGSGTNLNGVSSVTLKRQGNYVLCGISITQDQFSFNIPTNFRPKELVTFGYGTGNVTYNSQGRVWQFTGGAGTAQITVDGVCTVTGSGTSNTSTGHGGCSCYVQLGWEALPIDY